MKLDIVEVFTRAAKITWKHKVLWIFGILASCGRSSGGSSNSGSSSSGNGNGVSDNPLTPEMMRQVQSVFERLVSWFEQNTWIIYAIIAFILLSMIVQIFFSLVGTAGLARGVVKAESGAESLRFGELFSESLGYFWRLFGAALVIWLPYLVIFFSAMLIGLIPVINGSVNETAFGGAILLILILICCCMFPISLALSLYHVQVKRSIIVEDKGVFGSLARGWQIFSQNMIPLLIVGIVLGVAGFIIGIILSLPILLLMLPLISLFIQGNITSWQPFIAVGVFIICYSPIAWLFSGVLITYTESVWTLAYMRIITPKEMAPVFIEANA